MSRASDEWETPESQFNELNAEFGFDLDAATRRDIGWVDGHWFGPDHSDPYCRNALAVARWTQFGRVVFLNPPYSQCRAFMAKAAEQARDGCTVVCLVPARTDTRWWHEHVWDRETNTWRAGVEGRFVKGRLKFGHATAGAPFPSAVIIFRPSGACQ